MAGSILIVEDDPTLARSIMLNLTARGYITQHAMTVAEATAAVARQLPALVVLDIDLPDGSGWEVLRSLRAAGQPEVAVIVMSALRPNNRLANELGATGVLEKPFPMESLLRLVAQCCPGPTAQPPVEPETAG